MSEYNGTRLMVGSVRGFRPGIHLPVNDELHGPFNEMQKLRIRLYLSSGVGKCQSCKFSEIPEPGISMVGVFQWYTVAMSRFPSFLRSKNDVWGPDSWTTGPPRIRLVPDSESNGSRLSQGISARRHGCQLAER